MLRRMRASGVGARGRVSWLTVRGGGGTCEYVYTDTIRENTREGRQRIRGPRGKTCRVCGQTGRTSTRMRTGGGWCVEVGHLMLENGRARTRRTTPAACTYCLVSSRPFYNAWVTAAALLAAACRPAGRGMPPCWPRHAALLAMRGRALKWMESATALGRLLFDPALKPEPPPETSEVSSFEALLR